MKRNRISWTIVVLFIILITNVAAFVYEYFYINIQKKTSRNPLDGIKYQQRKSFSHTFSSILDVVFFMTIYHFNDALRLLTESDYDFTFVVLLVRWVVFKLPAELLDLSIEQSYGFSYTSQSEYINNSIIKEGIAFLMAFITNFIINIVLKMFDFIINGKNIAETENDFEQRSNGEQMPEIELERRYHFDFIRANKIIICTLIIVGIQGATVISFKKHVIDVRDLSNPSKKLENSLLFLNATQRFDLTDTTKMRMHYKKIGHACIEFSGLIKHSLIVSDNMILLLNSLQLSAIISSNYYRTQSNETLVIYSLYLLEIIIFVAALVASKSCTEDVSRRFISGVISKNIASFYPIHCLFSVARNFVHRNAVISADEIVVDKLLPIADTLVRIYFFNKDTIVHSHLYASIHFSEPTLQDRLVNIAVAKSKYAID